MMIWPHGYGDVRVVEKNIKMKNWTLAIGRQDRESGLLLVRLTHGSNAHTLRHQLTFSMSTCGALIDGTTRPAASTQRFSFAIAKHVVCWCGDRAVCAPRRVSTGISRDLTCPSIFPALHSPEKPNE